MAYQIVETTNKFNVDVPLGVKTTLNGPGLFVPVYSTDEQGVQNLKNLLLTRVGERYDKPTFGTNLLSLIFMPISNETKILLYDMITSAINTWLPEITIINLDVVNSEDTNTTTVKLTFSVNGSAFRELTLTANESGTLQVE